MLEIPNDGNDVTGAFDSGSIDEIAGRVRAVLQKAVWVKSTFLARRDRTIEEFGPGPDWENLHAALQQKWLDKSVAALIRFDRRDIRVTNLTTNRIDWLRWVASEVIERMAVDERTMDTQLRVELPGHYVISTYPQFLMKMCREIESAIRQISSI